MTETELQRNAVQYLNRSPLLHTDMLVNLSRGTGRILQENGEGVLLSAPGTLMLSADSQKSAKQLLRCLANVPAQLEVHRDCCRDATESLGLSVFVTCRQAAWLQEGFLPPATSPAEIRQLDESWLPFVMQHYKTIDNADYIQKRLRTGDFFGSFVKGRPAGFIGTHSEGSMGLLVVLPEYRRMGIASALETFLANRLIAKGITPFAQIVQSNVSSFSLHRKLGFKITEEKIYWLHSKGNAPIL